VKHAVAQHRGGDVVDCGFEVDGRAGYRARQALESLVERFAATLDETVV
jgi:hypothetical protein